MYEWTNEIKRKKWKIQSWLFIEPADAEIFQTQWKIPQHYTPAREDYVYQILVQNQLYITFDYQ